MKKIVFLMLMVFGMMTATQAQGYKTLKTVPNGTVTLDTVTNTETEYLYGFEAGASKLSIQCVFTLISGTANGVATVEFSLDGTNYEPINANDTFHVAPTTTSTHIWYITSAPTSYYRVKVVGRGTAAIQINGGSMIRKDP